MIITFSNEKPNIYTPLVISIVKSLEIEILNKDTVMDTINDPDFNFLLFLLFLVKVN